MNFPNFTLSQALEKDTGTLKKFLVENKLRPSIVLNENSVYYYIRTGNEIIGTIGAEFNQNYALIRAAGISQEWRKQGIATILYQKLQSELEKKGILHFYLFSRQAPEFWSKMGYVQCTVQEVIDVLPDAPQVKEFIADDSIWSDVAWYKAASS